MNMISKDQEKFWILIITPFKKATSQQHCATSQSLVISFIFEDCINKAFEKHTENLLNS